jgi:hypothetical protein
MKMTANTFTSESVNYIRGLVLPVILLLFIPGPGADAAEISGTVRDVTGKNIVIDIEPGQQPGIGDKVEISFTIAEKKFMVGDWRVTGVNGNTVYAEEEQVKLPVDTGMQAVIFTGTSTAMSRSGPAASQPAPTAEQQTNSDNELFWRNQDVPASTPAAPDQPAHRAAADSTDELFWLKPGYQHGQVPATASQTAPQAPVPRAPPPVTEASVLPPAATGNGAIQSVATRQYTMIWNDAGSGAQVDFATYRPVGPPGYYPLGDVALAGPWRGPRYGSPSFTSLMVKDGRVPLALPVDYRLVWSSRGSNSSQPFSNWEPVAPSGYQCLGDVGIAAIDQKPATDAIRCIPDSCAVQTGIGQKIWDDRGSGAVQDFSAWRVPGVNLYIGIAAHARPRNTVYTIKPECL